MTKRIFRSTITVVIVVLLLSFILTTGVLYHYFQDLRLDELESAADYISAGIEDDGLSYLNELEGETYRVTWVDTDGTVLFDNEYDVAEMENHADREEIQDAMENSTGTSVRYSSTISENSIYYALRLDDDTILRVSTTQDSVWVLCKNLLLPFIVILIIACALAGYLSNRVAHRIVQPLSEIDLHHPEDADTYEELTPFVQRIAAQNREINAKMDNARQQQQEFAMITENMSEGMFTIDSRYQILSYNKSATRIFDMQDDVEYNSILSVNRSETFRNVVDSALQGRHAQQNLELKGRIYQVLANPVLDDDTTGELIGAVLLVLDITEKEEQERYRREFTANVSHELKTPLTSISGIAEIIKNGMVKEEDIPHFADKIYQESQRLINLIGDIIKLSRLDEQVPMEKEQVDLLDVARDVVKRLDELAQKNDVILAVEGQHAIVYGVRQVLTEMVYNVCDNAIKYNKPGGRVWVKVTANEEFAVVSVADTGIGIPEADQSRVFERFYRVDKSRSKAVGGTGLGLSIVKHGAELHHAEVNLESTEGEGTTITMTFPLQSSSAS